MFGRTSSHQCVPHATGMYQCSSCCMSCLCIHGQRQALVLEPQQEEPRAWQDTQQEDLDTAEVLTTIQALQLDLDFCRGTNHKQLVQVQEQECAVEQEHQDLVILMQQFQALMGKLEAQKQSQGLQYSPARLQEQLGATQAQEQQSLHQLSRTNEAIQGLHRKVAELQQQLCWQV
ncbi:polyamine-modulated factor 1-binding protein 1 isoform X1 [Agelaius tricolor]|uniref:polyamine-modulated factor 1-binding protein 1 isoform X1 n=1 Tax=Agelaius tricolor TaxID=9191 RepID=UPI0039F1C550